MEQGDIFFVDRGFRDVKNFLESEGYNILMPALKGKRKQLMDREANESRFVTKFRWSVEAIHEIIKQNDDGTINLQFVKDQTNILKILIKSRHISRKVYRCFVEYVPNGIGVSGIRRYACECANGRRTVGCCSHVATVIY
ncbi:uncharacterized protein LOC122508731 [Leptopilina heterotoma]|uniref:uncharacterized protein LOC122508731 n=1 Tax=Leptopilina heterotoma TaxID=63436 RepID=UPI001CA8F146|nr:uncharacterized protein LOC122508731 [Leptopilina heterotoma]